MPGPAPGMATGPGSARSVSGPAATLRRTVGQSDSLTGGQTVRPSNGPTVQPSNRIRPRITARASHPVATRGPARARRFAPPPRLRLSAPPCHKRSGSPAPPRIRASGGAPCARRAGLLASHRNRCSSPSPAHTGSAPAWRIRLEPAYVRSVRPRSACSHHSPGDACAPASDRKTAMTLDTKAWLLVRGRCAIHQRPVDLGC